MIRKTLRKLWDIITAVFGWIWEAIEFIWDSRDMIWLLIPIGAFLHVGYEEWGLWVILITAVGGVLLFFFFKYVFPVLKALFQGLVLIFKLVVLVGSFIFGGVMTVAIFKSCDGIASFIIWELVFLMVYAFLMSFVLDLMEGKTDRLSDFISTLAFGHWESRHFDHHCDSCLHYDREKQECSYFTHTEPNDICENYINKIDFRLNGYK